MTEKSVRSSILILCKNEARNIEPCLEAVFGQKGAGPFEVIVVDSGSTDGTREIAARVLAARAQVLAARDQVLAARAQVLAAQAQVLAAQAQVLAARDQERYPVRLEQIPPGTFHHARTRNYAASLADGEILVYLAADAFPVSENWLRALLANFEDKMVGAVYGRHVPKAGSSFEREDALSAVYGQERVVKEPASRRNLGYRYYHMSTVNAAIRRDVWAETKFPEELKVFEDLGIAKRILGRGWKIVYEPAASVYHSHHHTTLGLFKRYFDIGYTFRQLGIWNDSTKASLLQDAWKLVRRKVARFDSNGNGRKARASLSQDLAKSAGMLLGLNERFLPLILKRRMSAFGVYE